MEVQFRDALRRSISHVVALGAILLAWTAAPRNTHALAARDFAVELDVQVQVSPPRISLRWPAAAYANGYTVSRKLLQDTSWNQVASLPASATGFTDSGAVIGAAYEYEVAMSTPDGITAYGYAYSGIEVPFPGDRGRVVLMVDDAVASGLMDKLVQLNTDLVGDGWTVLRHDVPRSAPPGSVKELIRADYNADPLNTRAVFLVGHVPVPYSGDINPDMHPSHLGAWPADVFYGDMDGTWTDGSVNDTSAEDPRNHNVPADGKFDQSEIPGRVVLQVGRVDFSDLPAFAPASEVDLLRQYLDKNHAFRHRQFAVQRRALVRDNFGEIQGDAPAADAWRSFAPLVGSANVTAVAPGSFFSALNSESYLWAYGGGGGEYYQADGVGSTTDFARESPQCVFFMLHGSYFGDWDFPDDFLRAALASSGYGLAAAWTGLPHWFLHPMGLGETIGFSAMLAQNNRGLYKNQVNLSAGQVHIALMGDPTLRMHAVAPPSDLAAISGGDGTVALSWRASPDPVYGYYVYRSAGLSGPFSRLTRSYITGGAYLDRSPPAGPKTYMVRAVLLETSPSGSYFNPSQGIFANTDGGGGQPLPAVTIEAVNPIAAEAGPLEGGFVVSRSGPVGSDLPVSFLMGGSAGNGVDYERIASTITIPAGASDAWISIWPIPDETVEGDETVTLTLTGGGAYTIGTPSSATVRIQDAPISPAPVNRIELISRQPDGSVRLQFIGAAGKTYIVEKCTDFQTWSSVGHGVFGPAASAEFVDQPNTNGLYCFYRVQWQ